MTKKEIQSFKVVVGTDSPFDHLGELFTVSQKVSFGITDVWVKGQDNLKNLN